MSGPQLANCGRVLTAGDLKDGRKTKQNLFQLFLGEYINKDNLSYSQHAFKQVDDFADAANIPHCFQPQKGIMLGGGLER
jgi:hypothetical protein